MFLYLDMRLFNASSTAAFFTLRSSASLSTDIGSPETKSSDSIAPGSSCAVTLNSLSILLSLLFDQYVFEAALLYCGYVIVPDKFKDRKETDYLIYLFGFLARKEL